MLEASLSSTVAPVRFWHWDRTEAALAVNVTSHGAFVRTSMAVPAGAYLTVRLDLPGQSGLTLLAKVERLVLQGATTSSGLDVRFVDATPAQRQRLESCFTRSSSSSDGEQSWMGR